MGALIGKKTIFEVDMGKFLSGNGAAYSNK